MAEAAFAMEVTYKLMSIIDLDVRTASLPPEMQSTLRSIDIDLNATILSLNEMGRQRKAFAVGFDILQRFQNVIYVLDDVLDLLLLELGYEGNNGRLKEQVSLTLPDSTFIVRNLLEISGEIKDVRETLPSMDADAVLFIPEYDTRVYEPCDNGDILGREEDTELIVSWICGAHDVQFPSVAIVGVSGIGKSTVAQLVLDDPWIKNNFEFRSSVHVKQQHTPEDIVRTIIANGRGDLGRRGWEVRTGMTQERLIEVKYILVLDNYQSLDGGDWLKLRDLLYYGRRGSTIVITTVDRQVAYKLKANYVHQLKPLSKDISLRLLKGTAISEQHTLGDPMIEHLADMAAQRCIGIPLFLKNLNHQLRCARGGAYTQILGKPTDSLVTSRGLTDYFRTAYQVLPSYLKLPFGTLFLHKHCGLNVDQLICLWMALGFTESQQTSQQPEDVGMNFIHRFADLWVIDDLRRGLDGNAFQISMSSAMFDLASLIASKQWCMIDSQQPRIAVKTSARYIFFDAEGPGFPFPADNARAVMIRARNDANQLIRDIVSNSMLLRALGVGGCGVKELPDSIGRLRLLRYLDLAKNNSIKRLPDSICDLVNLQSLFLHGCDSLEQVPDDIGKLESLRYLTLTTLQETLPDGMGNLVSLRTLALANCKKLACLPRSFANLKTLKTLALVDCPELDLMEDSSDHGLRGMNSIVTLLLVGLPRFVGIKDSFTLPLKHLLIQNCSRLAQVKWIEHLVRLYSLGILNCPGLLTPSTSGEDCIELKNLEPVQIRREVIFNIHPHVQHIPKVLINGVRIDTRSAVHIDTLIAA